MTFAHRHKYQTGWQIAVIEIVAGAPKMFKYMNSNTRVEVSKHLAFKGFASQLQESKFYAVLQHYEGHTGHHHKAFAVAELPWNRHDVKHFDYIKNQNNEKLVAMNITPSRDLMFMAWVARIFKQEQFDLVATDFDRSRILELGSEEVVSLLRQLNDNTNAMEVSLELLDLNRLYT